MSFRRASILGCLFAPALLIACEGDDIPAPGSIMLSITTDMQARKDLDGVGLVITSNGKVLFEDVRGIAPEIYFPSTMALVGSKDEAKPVHIRVYAFKGTKARILRQAITTVPTDRSVLLRMPIEWANDGSVEGTFKAGGLLSDSIQPEDDFVPRLAEPPTLFSKCAKGETMVAGVCTSAAIDSSSLPMFDNSEVFGTDDPDQGSVCYDVKSCFGSATVVSLDENCEGAGVGANGVGGNVAYAIKLPFAADGTDGECIPNVGCLVPLSSAAITPASEGRIRLPANICAKRNAGTTFELVATTTCAPVDGLQVCGDAAREGSQPTNGLDQPGGTGGTGPKPGDGERDASVTAPPDGGGSPADAEAPTDKDTSAGNDSGPDPEADADASAENDALP